MKEAEEKNIKITHILTDNGTEFTDTLKIQKITQAMLFYTHAYASWEKGSIENFNRIIRRFYPKRTDFSRLAPKAIEILQYKLVNYPRPTQLKTKAAA
jgi:IS30 family transposase